MDRIYRIRQGMGGRYALEREGELFWLEGDLFGALWPAGVAVLQQRRGILVIVPQQAIAGGASAL